MPVDHRLHSRFGTWPPHRAGATVVCPPRGSRTAAAGSSCVLGFVLFLLVNSVLFIRPAEIVPSLEELPVYEILIVACLLSSLPVVVGQLNGRSLRANPVTVCALGMLVAVVLSQLTNFSFYGARTVGVEFAKVLVYYLLCVGLLNTPSRVRQFLLWLVAFIAVVAGLALF